jgi:hypothetical protein
MERILKEAVTVESTTLAFAWWKSGKPGDASVKEVGIRERDWKQVPPQSKTKLTSLEQ